MNRLPKVHTRSESVFLAKEARKNKHYNILLLIDESGSMIDRAKIVLAADCAVFLANNFKGLSVDVAILGFNHNLHVRKRFGSPNQSRAELEKMYSDICEQPFDDGGCNHDLAAFEHATTMFRDCKKTGRNLIVWLSDGHPSSCAVGNGLQPVKSKISDKHETISRVVNSHKDITTVGLGMLYDPRQIPQRVVINNLDELKTQFIQILRKQVVRG